MTDTKKTDLKKATKLWTKEEIKKGHSLTLPIVMVAIVSTLAGLGQIWCVASILGTILVQWQAHLPLSCSPHLFIGFVVFTLLQALCMYAQDAASNKASISARRRIRGDVIDRVLSAGPSLLRTRHSASLMATIVDRVEALDGFFGHYVPASRLWMILPLIMLCVVWYVQPFSAYILAACGFAIPVGQALFGIGAMVASRKQFLAMTRLQIRFLDRIRGIATIVLAGRVDDEARRLSQSAEELRKRTMKILRVAFFSSASIDCAMVVAFIVLAVMLGRHILVIHSMVAYPALEHSVIVALFSLLIVPQYFAPFRSLALAYQDRAHAQGAASAIIDLPKKSLQKHARPVDVMAGKDGISVSFDHVSFTWDKARGEVLRDVSFVVKPRSVMKIIGPSGAGKTTLLDLILGFDRPQKGHIFLNDCDLADVPSAQRAQLMSWIGQDPVIFSGTVRDNILFAKPHATQAQLQQAIEGSGVDAFLHNLPQGLETPLGEGGFGLSGGQAQRVVLARAWLKDAPLLLLDEPTSHLDRHSQKHFFKALERLAHGRTVIVVTHAQRRDQLPGEILELNNGSVTPVGECHA